MKSLKKQAEDLAKSLNAEIEVGEYNSYDKSTEFTAIAPDGMQWCEGGCVHMCAFSFRYVKGSANEAWQDLIDRMNYGLEKFEE